MQIFKISKNYNFNISCINNDDIYNVQDNRIFKRNIYDFDSPLPFSDPLKEEPIGIFYISSLILIFKDKIFLFENEQVKKIEIFNNPILKVKQYKNYLIILTLDNKIYKINENDYDNHFNINIISNNNLNINIIPISNIFKDFTDFCLNQNFTFILDNSGFIFKTFSILFTDSLNLRKPMKIIPEPTEKPNSIHINLNLFLCYNNFIEVYNINDNILNLIYKYNTNFYKIIEGDKIYCLDKTLNLLGEYPKVIINNLIENKIGKVCISKGKMYVIDDYKGSKGKVKGYEVKGGYDNEVKVKGHNNGIKIGFKNEKSLSLPSSLSLPPSSSLPPSTYNSLVNLLFSLRSDFEIKSNSNKNSILKDFDSLILDKYRRFYLELNSINDSILEKKKILDKSEMKILEKINKIDKKKIEILEKFKKKMEKYNEILRKTKINGKEINKNYEELKRKLKEKQEKSKFREELVIQRNMLTRKVV